ncbi:MAG: Gfo/Idh/MocA family oxidoreductase [Caldilineaceae bacterium]|nr:Gfo/Idh/MocA family oxidoreductase [Caldilineaceae bacterium]
MANLRLAVFGTGFWSLYQIPAWYEVGGVEIVACYNRTVSRAENVAKRFGIPRVYGDPEELFRNETLDLVDIITEVPAHEPLVLLAAKYKVPVICQKPMAASYESAQRMVNACEEAGIPFFVHENYRWQAPVRAAKKLVEEGHIGRLFRGRFEFRHELPEFAWQNQPLLKQLERLVLADQGSHQFDLARFFFGEAQSIYAQHLRVREDIAGEDVASALLKMGNALVNVNISFVSKTQEERFPETTFYLEGDQGTLELRTDFWVHMTTAAGTLIKRYAPPRYTWADPAYDVNHASMVPLHENFLRALRTGEPPENTGADNLKTMRLVYAAYESAAENRVIQI